MLGMSSRLYKYVDLFTSFPPRVLSVHVPLHSELIDENHLYPFSLHLEIEVNELEFQSNTCFKRIGVKDMICFMISDLQVLFHVSPYCVAYRYLQIWQSLNKLCSNS